MVRHACRAIARGGGPCQAPPLRDHDYCRMHSPEHAEAVAEARRVGGQHRRREATVATVYDFEGFHSVEQVRRFLDIAGYEALSLEPSVARIRVMTAIAQTAARLLEVSEFAERLELLEAAVAPGRSRR